MFVLRHVALLIMFLYQRETTPTLNSTNVKLNRRKTPPTLTSTDVKVLASSQWEKHVVGETIMSREKHFVGVLYTTSSLMIVFLEIKK